jgi:Protein of unknown function (DUF2752)
VSRPRTRRLAAALVAVGFLASVFLLPARRPLPFDVCPFHRLTGLPCPTCGLTRSVCLFARGEWTASLRMHPAGWLAFASLVVASVWLLGEAGMDRDLGSRLRIRLVALALGFGAGLSVVAWGARLAGVWPRS